MKSPHPATISVEQLMKGCTVSRLRRGGPGGQHRNKVETAVVIEHRPTGIRAEANERRSQADNQAQATFRLRVLLAIQFRSEPPLPKEPSELWQSRCRAGRIEVNARHEDFPALLAEGLDRVAGHEFNLKPAAESLRITSSQLIKFLKLEPNAWKVVNVERENRGLHPMK